MAPPPFTADEMRAGTPSGRTVVLEETSPDSGEKTRRTILYTNVNPTGGGVHVTFSDASGAALASQITATFTWAQQERQVTRPANVTRIEQARITVPAGTFDTLLYTVDELRDDGLRRVMKDWYAREVPGIPVKSLMTLDGRVVHDSVLLENRSR